MGEGEDDSGSLDSDSDLILDGENAAGVGAGKFQCIACCLSSGKLYFASSRRSILIPLRLQFTIQTCKLPLIKLCTVLIIVTIMCRNDELSWLFTKRF